PENAKNYPEPSMFGVTPSYGFYIRHVKGLTFDNLEVTFENIEERPAFFLDDVKGVEFFRTNAQLATDAKMFVLKNVSNFSSSQSRNREDIKLAKTERQDIR
ncbi:MAG: glycoside hydrolase family 28 protein, partial [Pyrinomonadaceae bacterium]